MSTIKVNAIQNTDGITVYTAKAWVNFNGTTGAIRSSGGISSVTRASTGRYTVTMSNAQPDANYSVVGAASHTTASTNPAALSVDEGTAPTTTVFALRVNQGTSNLDSVYCNVAVFR